MRKKGCHNSTLNSTKRGYEQGVNQNKVFLGPLLAVDATRGHRWKANAQSKTSPPYPNLARKKMPEHMTFCISETTLGPKRADFRRLQ